MGTKQIWVDVETTGLSAETDCIIEIAALYKENEFHEYCLPSAKPDNWSQIEELTGITWEFLQEKGISEKELYNKFNQWLATYIDKFSKSDKAVFCAYGAHFDSQFVRNLFLRNNDKFYGSYFISLPMDVQSFVSEALINENMITLGNYKLKTVCEHLKISIKAHSAISDIKATRDLYHSLKVGATQC